MKSSGLRLKALHLIYHTGNGWGTGGTPPAAAPYTFPAMCLPKHVQKRGYCERVTGVQPLLLYPSGTVINHTAAVHQPL